MEVLDWIYNDIFFTANSFGWQPSIFQYVQPLALQPLALAPAAIYCTLSEYASGWKATILFSQAEYQGSFWPSPVVNITPEGTALINYGLVGGFIPYAPTV